MWKKALLTLAALAAAVALVAYVYPTHPYLVWTLLGLCWGCYRLTLRARARFALAKVPVSRSGAGTRPGAPRR